MATKTAEEHKYKKHQAKGDCKYIQKKKKKQKKHKKLQKIHYKIWENNYRRPPPEKYSMDRENIKNKKAN